MDYNTIKDFFLRYLNTFGLAFNFIGTLFIVFFISKDTKEWVENEGKLGERWYCLLIKHPRWLSFGIILIIIGFALSLVDGLLK